MNTKYSTIIVLVMSLVISGCGAGQILDPTVTPPPTINPVPRWMILPQPGYGVEILGEKWNYTNDRWGETYACIDYIREKEPYLFFEQCFELTQPDLTFESQRDVFLNDDYEVLTPTATRNATTVALNLDRPKGLENRCRHGNTSLTMQE